MKYNPKYSHQLLFLHNQGIVIRFVKFIKDQTKKSDQLTEVTNLQLLSIDKLKELYSYPLNSDLKIRELYLSNSKKRL